MEKKIGAVGAEGACEPLYVADGACEGGARYSIFLFL